MFSIKNLLSFRRINLDQLPTQITWRGDIRFKEKLTIDDAKFLYENAEKVLKDSFEVSETIVNRTSTLLTIIIGLLIAFTGYLITHWETDFILGNDFYTACLGSAYLFTLALYTYRNMMPVSYFLHASLPIDLFVPEFFADEVQSSKRIILYYVNEFENFQFRIEVNGEINKTRWKIYRRTFDYLLFFPVALFAIYILLEFNF